MGWIVFWSLFFVALMVSDICDAYVKTHSKNNNKNEEDD